MRILILGANGMLGHKLTQVFSQQFEVLATVRSSTDTFAGHPVLAQEQLLGNVSVENFDSIVRAIALAKPQYVVNCIGIVKQQLAAKDPLPSISVNALFPHRLAQVCQAAGIRLIHISTDCVFSGHKGNYLESDVADAEDLYGRTKLLGEVGGEGCLTLRTSIIGREFGTSYGLIDWFLSQEGKSIRGYKKAIFSGFTTHALAEIIAQIITQHSDLQGIWHVAAEPINKFELLSLVKEVYRLNIQIEPDEVFLCDRSLNSDRFRQATEFVPPSWQDMIEQMYQDPTPYSKLRGDYAIR
ncbi:SDR family oxidoreductase [Microcoleus sp. FACHB-SPT15]|uniref:dTDP-4-dehydrorhamnose reductase family protein n=1 Tax=Microcoleus sp. FACHB-SPT15 TaxID=2692830 RepID=UPI001782E5C0|nr:SDR family oxidoreductase [Microcoleus sp. FACHB-SPT15]MBD1807688.1 SDR family oxidoreductase [Microcoleus sp. FACHB-SPT15]